MNIDDRGMWDNTPLICACQYGHGNIFPPQCGSRFRAYRVCLMLRCCACARAERLANLLIVRGADVNLLNEKVRCSPRQRLGTCWRVGAGVL